MTRRRTAFAGLIGAVLLTAGVVAGLGLAPGQIRPASAQRLSQSVATVAPTVVPTATNGIDVQFTFKAIQQGRAGLIVVNSTNLAASSVTAFGRVYPCFPTHTGFGCLLAVPMDQAVKTGYPVTVNITTKDGVILPAANTFAVSPGGFLAEPITLPGSLLYMIKPDVQANEDARLLGAYSLITPQRYWEGAFSKPVNSIPTSAFGGIRNYNGIATLRHTGQDLQAVVGTPVLASASGRVVLSRLMDIHGNNIVIDHGWGIYSEYAHLSERYVVPGQFVLQGQIIGLSGNTGRSTGPHLHWEIAINGIWVNPLDFMQMTLPPP
jgi:murein DD-endopeptidase MepM/ murein hydrolase activator NlpD